jgi:hypothetical protein
MHPDRRSLRQFTPVKSPPPSPRGERGRVFDIWIFSDLDDLSFDLLSEMEDPEGGSVNKGACGGAGVEEVDIFDLMIRRGMAVAVNNRIDLVKFSPDA